MKIIGVNKVSKKDIVYFEPTWPNGELVCYYHPFQGRKISRLLDDNRHKIDPNDYEWNIELSCYMPAHIEYGDCCGIFNILDEHKMVVCNECGMKLVDLIKELYTSEDMANALNEYAEEKIK